MKARTPNPARCQGLGLIRARTHRAKTAVTDVKRLITLPSGDGNRCGKSIVSGTSKAPTQFVDLLAARKVCTDANGDAGIRKASSRMPEQGTQTPSPAPDLIPAETEKQPRTHTEIGTVNGTSR
jgi:hypothetical protein